MKLEYKITPKKKSRKDNKQALILHQNPPLFLLFILAQNLCITFIFETKKRSFGKQRR
jgi:hypothetical protein